MFSRFIPSVVEMNPMHLARDDGSVQSAGRGSGRVLENGSENSTAPTPYMSQAFWPIERRLDQAIYRALFANSVEQASMMVVHGHVKVNGKPVSPLRALYTSFPM